MDEKTAIIEFDKIDGQIRQWEVEKDLNSLSKAHAALSSKDYRKYIDNSIYGINKFEKFKIRIEMIFGDFYKNLQDERLKGLKQFVPLSDDLTTENRQSDETEYQDWGSDLTEKQQAAEDIGKSRETINKYKKMSDLEDRDKVLEEYEAKCNEKGMEMSSAGFINFAITNTVCSIFSSNDEWCTPEKYIEKARLVMGSIDIDPASSTKAQKIVNAKQYFTIDTNGLDKEWKGNIYMNPPYSPKLSDIGINRNQSSNWQRIASIPEEKFEDIITDIIEGKMRSISGLQGHKKRD